MLLCQLTTSCTKVNLPLLLLLDLRLKLVIVQHSHKTALGNPQHKPTGSRQATQRKPQAIRRTFFSGYDRK